MKGGSGKLVILDEADSLLLDKRLQVKGYQGGGQTYVIGLTATGKGDMEEFEETHFEDLDYHTIDSGLKTTYRYNEVPKWSTRKEFFSERYHGTVRLMFAE